MAHRKLYAYRLTVYKASSATDTARVPAASVTATAAKRGAFCQGAGNDTAGAGATITVHNINGVAVGDLILINTGTTFRFVSSVTATTIVTTAGGTGTFAWVDGDRIRVLGNPPPIFTDADAVEEVSLVTTDSSGEAEFYCAAPIVDVTLTDSGTATLLPDIAGADGQEEIKPESWGANRDGSTADQAFFTDMTEYATAQSGALKIKLGAGTYRLGGVWTLPALSSVEIEGQGIGVTTIEINHTGVGLDLTGACTDLVIKNLTINRLSGTVAAIQVSSSCVRPRVQNVLFKGGGIGIDDNGSDDARYLNTFFTTGTWVSFITLNDAVRPHITDLSAQPTANWTRGIDVSTGCSRVRMTNLDISPNGAYVGIGVHCRDDATGTDPKGVFLVASHISAGSTKPCVEIDNGDGIVIDGCEFTASDKAIQIDGGAAITITGCQSDNMQSETIDINATAGVIIIGLLSSDASQSSGGAAAHIDVASGIGRVIVMGCRFGNFVTGGATYGTTGINLAGGATTAIIAVGNEIVSSGSGSVIADATTAGSINAFGSNVNALSLGGNLVGGPSGKDQLTVTGGVTTFVATGHHSCIFNATAAGSLLTITGGYDGQLLTITRTLAGDITVADDSGAGTGLYLAGSASFTLSPTFAIQLMNAGSDTWVEVSRSTN